MRMLRLPAYFYPEQVASTHMGTDLAEAYREAGIHCVIYAPTPCRGIDAATRKKYKKLRHEEQYDGMVEIHRFPLFAERRNPLLRAFRYLVCIIEQTVCGLRAKDCDLLFIASTPPINGLMMAVLHRFKKYKIVYNLQDIFPDSLVNTGMTRRGSLLWKIGRRIENMTYRAADRIIVISESFKKNIMEKGVPEEKIVVIPNWVNEQEVFPVRREENPLFDRYGLDRDRFYVVYSGNIGHTQNIELLAEVADRLREHTDVGFVIIGEGAAKPKLEALIAEKGLDNMTLLPFQDYADIAAVFSLGDAGLIISKAGIAANSVPSKTWSIMAAGRPVLASFDENSELCDQLRELGAGVCVPADDAAALEQAILSMAADRAAAARLGENGYRYVTGTITKDRCTARYIQTIREAAGEETAHETTV